MAASVIFQSHRARGILIETPTTAVPPIKVTKITGIRTILVLSERIIEFFVGDRSTEIMRYAENK